MVAFEVAGETVSTRGTCFLIVSGTVTVSVLLEDGAPFHILLHGIVIINPLPPQGVGIIAKHCKSSGKSFEMRLIESVDRHGATFSMILLALFRGLAVIGRVMAEVVLQFLVKGQYIFLVPALGPMFLQQLRMRADSNGTIDTTGATYATESWNIDELSVLVGL